ncbi:hypothetical protein [Chitinophaga ginsengisoli]|uniref:Uncharacterized protein n=1 Tax=Chitinophaga ginsengisoli TaxID=363837 RepID=A0A2P8FDX9_9BACT|nr:hypothetical protein [Chitinophaga ginsengisoli]PSL19916.1 hypothetical protein CLV42_12629 [Chitinophaga ginsengisoli]
MLKQLIGLLFPPTRQDPNAGLKTTGNRITVNADAFTIFTSNYYEEAVNTENLEVRMLDGLIDRQADHVREREICYLSCAYQADNNTYIELLSPYIYKDRVTVNFLMEKHKQISIYLNPADCGEYYFDLDFLNA